MDMMLISSHGKLDMLASRSWITPHPMERGVGLKVLVIDDHPLVAQATAQILRQHYPDITVLEAGSGSRGIEQATLEAGIDLVILDLNLPDTDGFTLLKRIRAIDGLVPIAVFSANATPDLVTQALKAQASGFIPKSADSETILDAVRVILAGGIYVPKDVMASKAMAGQEGGENPGFRFTPLETSRLEDIGLSPREIEVFELMVAGDSNKVIGERLGIGESTVKAHVSQILRATRTGSRTQAVYFVTQGALR